MIPNGKNLYTETAKILVNEKMQVLYDFIKAKTGINIEKNILTECFLFSSNYKLKQQERFLQSIKLLYQFN